MPVTPWRKSDLVYHPQRPSRVDGASFVGEIETVYVGHYIMEPGKFPWQAMSPGTVLRIVLVNDSDEPRTLSAALNVTEVTR